MLFQLEFLPGIYRNSTEYGAGKANRYWNQSMTRWIGGLLAPIGGWTKFSTTATSGMPRTIISWRDTSGVRWAGIGTNTKLYAMNSSGVLSDITPTGFTTGNVDATSNLAYGTSTYGGDAYGTPRLDTGAVIDAAVWDLDTFGQNLVGCAFSDGKCYTWDLITTDKATAISNAPTGCYGLMVINAFMFALGASSDARKVQWSHQGDDTIWTPSSTNLAGSVELDTQGQIKRGIKIGSEALILTDFDAHVGTYVGLPSVWNFQRVGDGCGAISKGAVVATGQFGVWWSQGGFFIYQGGVVQPAPCDVWSYLLQNLNTSQKSKVSGFHNTKYGEVWWFYPSASSTENDSAVVWNYRDNWWGIHSIARTCGNPTGVFVAPIACDTSGYVYQHETGTNYGGAVPFAETGPIELGNGDTQMICDSVIPDDETVGDVTVDFRTRLYPDATETVLSEIALTSAGRADVRFMARQVKMRITAATNNDWRFGRARLSLRAGGTR
jgi:hypothetical protein